MPRRAIRQTIWGPRRSRTSQRGNTGSSKDLSMDSVSGASWCRSSHLAQRRAHEIYFEPAFFVRRRPASDLAVTADRTRKLQSGQVAQAANGKIGRDWATDCNDTDTSETTHIKKSVGSRQLGCQSAFKFCTPNNRSSPEVMFPRRRSKLMIERPSVRPRGHSLQSAPVCAENTIQLSELMESAMIG